MAAIEFASVTKRYPDGTTAVDGLDLRIGDGEFMVLVGPSGCGKSTALRMIAGLESITSGELRIDGEVVNDLQPQRRDIAMVFQNYALYPHMSIFENIAFPLRSTGVAKSEIRARVERAASMLALTDQLKRKPRNLSGGQRQRVAMGRAMVRNPQAFLMDEPLSNLDAKLRGQMRAEIARLQSGLGTTTVYVTHDQVEAMTMGDRIAVMRGGVLQQLGAADDLYDRPANVFVASFIGSPPMNLLECTVRGGEDGLSCRVGQQELRLSRDAPGALAPLGGLESRKLALGIRPEHLSERVDQTGNPTLQALVTQVENLGAERLVHLEIEANPLLTDDVLAVMRDVDAGAADLVQAQAPARTTIIARLGHDSDARAGQRLALAVDVSRVLLFDAESGDRVWAGSSEHAASGVS